MPGLLRPIGGLVPRVARGYGEKARNLGVLVRAGIPVPFTYALSASVCRRFLRRVLPGSDWIRTILSENRPPSEARLAAIRARIMESALPVQLRHDLREVLREGGARGIHAFAVRSSALHEDAADASAAGLHASFLNVRDERALFDAVRASWASLYQERVLTYLSRLGLEADPAVGLLVQEFVPAEASGVLFTVNPLTGDPEEMMVNATVGLGLGVTDGTVAPDVVRLDRATHAVRDAAVGDKQDAFVPALSGGVDRVPLADDQRRRRAVSDEVLVELAVLGERLEALFDAPQDVEWAVFRGRVVVLQTRPVTFVSNRDAARTVRSRKDRSSLVWSNLNVGEALPGVVTPLTWSVLSAFAEAGFRHAFGAAGCVVPPEAELFGNFRGRIFLNLSEFVQVASQVPGFRPEFLLSLGGGQDLESFLPALEVPGDHRGFLARLPLTVARLARREAGYARDVRAFEAEFVAERARLVDLDPRILAPGALNQMLRDTERLLHRTGTVMLTGYGRLLVLLLLLRALMRFAQVRDLPTLERDLLGGFSGLESAAPAFALGGVLREVTGDEALRRYLVATAPDGLSLADLPEGPGRRAIERFLGDHGYRGPREAELREPRWRERPEFILGALRAHLLEGRTALLVGAKERREARVRAERLLLHSLPWAARPVASRWIGELERMLVDRERYRARVTEVLGVFRAIALDVSRRLHAENPEYGQDAAFFLTLDEIHALLTERVRALSHLVRQRRQHFARDVALPEPPGTFMGSPPASDEQGPALTVLEGLPASGGYIEGRALVVQSALEAGTLSSEDILVVPHADIGWSPLFTIARGVVTELGGPLSHAAIVLREYGVPAVVNAARATRMIATGDRIAVDGDRGFVRILERAGGEPSP